jgi:ribosome-binding factor A
MVPRKDRLASEIMKVVSQIVQTEINDDDLGFVTILSSDVSRDLRNSTIYYSVLGNDEQKKKTDIIIRNSAKYIKKRLNDTIRLRYAVSIKLVRQTSIDEAFKIQEILNKIADEKDSQNS